MVFFNSHVWVWELDHKECWMPKNWYFWTMVLEETVESPKEIKSVNPKGNQPWIFIGRTDTEVKLWPPDVKSQLIGKDPETGKEWGQEERTIADEMVGCHHWLSGHGFDHTAGDIEGQWSLLCCSPWDHKKLDITKQVNYNNKITKLCVGTQNTLNLSAPLKIS